MISNSVPAVCYKNSKPPTSFLYYTRAHNFQVWALAELVGYSLLVTLRPLGHEGSVSVHKYALYIAAAVVSCLHLLFSILLVVAAVKVRGRHNIFYF